MLDYKNPTWSRYLCLSVVKRKYIGIYLTKAHDNFKMRLDCDRQAAP